VVAGKRTQNKEGEIWPAGEVNKRKHGTSELEGKGSGEREKTNAKGREGGKKPRKRRNKGRRRDETREGEPDSGVTVLSAL